MKTGDRAIDRELWRKLENILQLHGSRDLLCDAGSHVHIIP